MSERHVRQFPFATVCHKIARRNETKKMFQGDKKYLHVQNDCPFFQSIYMDVFVLGIELLQKKEEDVFLNTVSQLKNCRRYYYDILSKDYTIVFSIM